MLTRLLQAIAVLVFVSVVVVFGLIVTQKPNLSFANSEISRMPFESLTEGNFAGMPRVTNYTARDGILLPYRLYKASAPTKKKVYLLHDAGWHGMVFNDLATSLAYSGVADIIVPDLRGHGTSPAQRGSAQYTGQLEDDLADLIRQTSKADDTVIIGGYSFGGGLAIRFAAGSNANMAQHYFLMSPFLGFGNPVISDGADPWLHPLTRKMAGIKALSTVGLDLFGEDVVLQLSYPKKFLNSPLGYTVTPELDWHLVSSLDPSPVLEEGLSKMDNPLLVVIGARDELFSASAYKKELSSGTPQVNIQTVDAAEHINLLRMPKTLTIIQDWLADLP